MLCQQLKNLLPVAKQVSVTEPYLHMASQKQSLSQLLSLNFTWLHKSRASLLLSLTFTWIHKSRASLSYRALPSHGFTKAEPLIARVLT